MGILPKGEGSVAPLTYFASHSLFSTLCSSWPNSFKLPMCHAVLYLCSLSFMLLPLLSADFSTLSSDYMNLFKISLTAAMSMNIKAEWCSD